jgi:hypothetical protein
MYGPVQCQMHLSHKSVTPVKNHPILFCATDVQAGSDLSKIYYVDSGEALNIKLADSYWAKSDGHKFFANETEHVPNGPKMLLLEAEYTFKITGFLANTHVRIDFVRQKKAISGDYWNPSTVTNQMPYNADGFKELAGFTTNSIDTRTFQLLATRKVFFNSKGSKNLTDALIEGGGPESNTVDATTRSEQIVTVPLRWKGGKVIKQLDSSINEVDGEDAIDMDAATGDGQRAKGSYAFDNVHPLSNVWCIISTDDTTALPDIVTGQSVTVAMIRKLKWRDERV